MESSTEKRSAGQTAPGGRPEGISQDVRDIHARIQEELDLYAAFLSYRVQRDLFEIFLEKGLFPGLTWTEFLLVMERDEQLQSTSVNVLRTGILELPEQAFLDPAGESMFDAMLANDFQDSDMQHCIRLFSDEMGRAMVNLVMAQGQVFLYAQRIKAGNTQSWTQYLHALSEDEALWAEFLHCFRNALQQIDLKPVWLREDLGEADAGE